MLNVVEGIRAAAAKNAYAPALVSEGRVIAYGDVLAAVARISNALAERRLAPLTRVFLDVADPDLRMLVMIAAMHAGLVPFTLARPGESAELGPHLVIGAGGPTPAGLAADIVIDPGILAGTRGDPVLRDLPDRAAEDLLYIGTTTGTTGQRKLVAEFRGAHGARLQQAGMSDFVAGERSMFSVGGLTIVGVGFVLRMLSAGAAHVRYPGDARIAAMLINLAAVDQFMTTPGTIGDLMDEMEKGGARCPSLKRILLFGSLFQRALVERMERLFAAEICVTYGSGEVARVTYDRIEAATYEPGYVGRLLPDVRVLSGGTADDPAQITIGNELTGFRAYFDRGKVLTARPTVHTMPDLGYAHGDRLYLVGRDDEVFNVGGNKIAYSLIERVLLALPGVAEVALVGGLPLGEPDLLIIGIAGAPRLVLAELKSALLMSALSARAEGALRLFKLGRVPRNVMGKVDRVAVMAAYKASISTG